MSVFEIKEGQLRDVETNLSELVEKQAVLSGIFSKLSYMQNSGCIMCVLFYDTLYNCHSYNTT